MGNYAVFDADDDGGFGGALDDAGGEDADDAAMPAFAVDEEQTIGDEFGVGGETLLDGAEGSGFGVAAFAVEAFELGGQFRGAVRVAGGKELDDFGGDVHAAGGVDARSEAESNIEAGIRLAAGSRAATAKRARRPAPAGRRSSLRPRAAITRFSPWRGTASAMVAMAAILRKLGRVFSRVRAGSRRSSTA